MLIAVAKDFSASSITSPQTNENPMPISVKDVFTFQSDQSRVKPLYPASNETNQHIRLAVGMLSIGDISKLTGSSELSIRRAICLGRLQANYSEAGPIVSQNSFDAFLGSGRVLNDMPKIRESEGWFHTNVLFKKTVSDFKAKVQPFVKTLKAVKVPGKNHLSASLMPDQITNVFSELGREVIANRIHQAAQFTCQRDGGFKNPIETLFSDAKYFQSVKAQAKKAVMSETLSFRREGKRIEIQFSDCAGSKQKFERLVDEVLNECF